MLCQNCGERIVNEYVRAGKNSTVFCSENCSYEAFDGYYTKDEVDKTMERHTMKGAN